ncbi:MAG: hypothetical protein WCL39_03940 [Armatimonadota bacterium]
MEMCCAVLALILSSAFGSAFASQTDTEAPVAIPGSTIIFSNVKPVATGQSVTLDVHDVTLKELKKLLEPQNVIVILGGEKAKAAKVTISLNAAEVSGAIKQIADKTGLACTKWPNGAFIIGVVPKLPSVPSLPPNQGAIVGTGAISTLNGQTRNLLHTPEDAARQVKRNPLMTPDDHPNVQLVKLQPVKQMHAAKVIPKTSKQKLHPSR